MIILDKRIALIIAPIAWRMVAVMLFINAINTGYWVYRTGAFDIGALRIAVDFLLAAGAWKRVNFCRWLIVFRVVAGFAYVSINAYMVGGMADSTPILAVNLLFTVSIVVLLGGETAGWKIVLAALSLAIYLSYFLYMSFYWSPV